MGILVPKGAVNVTEPLASVPSFLRDASPLPEGDRQVSSLVTWGANFPSGVALVNLNSIDTAPLSRICALYVSNLFSTADAEFFFPDTGFILTVPAGETGLFPVVTNQAKQFYVMAPQAVAGDQTVWTAFNYVPPPVAMPIPLFNAIATTGTLGIADGTTNLIGAGLSGLVTAIDLDLSGAIGGGGAGTVTVQIQDGDVPTTIATAAVTVPAAATLAFLPGRKLLSLTGLSIRYTNGLNAVVAHTGTAPASGQFAVNIYHRETVQP